MNRYEVRRIAANFWKDVGEPEPFPRSLEPAVYWALPIGVFKLPNLWVSDVQVWLAEQGIQFQLASEDRSLHGCLIARRGRGCVFLNGTDSDDELRFSLAHEVAHFLLDYHLPRQTAVNLLGPSVLEVFDGLRPATFQERVHAVLSQVSVGFHTHLMARNENGVMGCSEVGAHEESADQLALELLAPEKEARLRVTQALRSAHGLDRIQIASQVLQQDFGLPPLIAISYGRRLYQSEQTYSVREWLQQRS